MYHISISIYLFELNTTPQVLSVISQSYGSHFPQHTVHTPLNLLCSANVSKNNVSETGEVFNLTELF